ncbi:tRNA (guanosine(46)-N7)-methyltransferase TrmB [Candidatus Marinamargulisbacteria bacterium SCGC AG-439-L15]|nr:tRNA (guanosine(46)-N7)-methyltransferase TrmB [Candidatus Marinamargulisbacteria bacterium SCGC AG-439-L15]
MKKKRFRTHANPLNFRETIAPLKIGASLPEGTPLDLEIGFGRGVFIRQYAKAHPDRYVLGVEVRKPVAMHVQDLIKTEGLMNAHVLYGEGKRFLEEALEDKCLDRIFIFHPDPWFKKKHYKRRVINPLFLTILQRKLKVGGRIFVSTDVPDLWEDIDQHFMHQKAFQKIEEAPFWEQYYKTHWSVFSEKDERSCHCGTWECL